MGQSSGIRRLGLGSTLVCQMLEALLHTGITAKQIQIWCSMGTSGRAQSAKGGLNVPGPGQYKTTSPVSSDSLDKV